MAQEENAHQARRSRAEVLRMAAWRALPNSGRFGSRSADPPRTAFVLSGGGNQGVAQVGMLRAVIERGILPE